MRISPFGYYLLGLATSLSVAAATAGASDPRNGNGYRVLFDLGADSKESAMVKGYGGYLQSYFKDGIETFRFCDNFEGSIGGKPNPERHRLKLIPMGQKEVPGSYSCFGSWSLTDLKSGRKLIGLSDKKAYFFVTIGEWQPGQGGELTVRIGQDLSTKTFRLLTLRLRPTSDGYDTDMVDAAGKSYSAEWLQFVIGPPKGLLNIPNTVESLVLEPEGAKHPVDLNSLPNP